MQKIWKLCNSVQNYRPNQHILGYHGHSQYKEERKKIMSQNGPLLFPSLLFIFMIMVLWTEKSSSIFQSTVHFLRVMEERYPSPAILRSKLYFSFTKGDKFFAFFLLLSSLANQPTHLQEERRKDDLKLNFFLFYFYSFILNSRVKGEHKSKGANSSCWEAGSTETPRPAEDEQQDRLCPNRSPIRLLACASLLSVESLRACELAILQALKLASY